MSIDAISYPDTISSKTNYIQLVATLDESCSHLIEPLYNLVVHIDGIHHEFFMSEGKSLYSVPLKEAKRRIEEFEECVKAEVAAKISVVVSKLLS